MVAHGFFFWTLRPCLDVLQGVEDCVEEMSLHALGFDEPAAWEQRTHTVIVRNAEFNSGFHVGPFWTVMVSGSGLMRCGGRKNCTQFRRLGECFQTSPGMAPECSA